MKKPATLTLLIVLYKFASIVNFFKYIYIYTVKSRVLTYNIYIYSRVSVQGIYISLPLGFRYIVDPVKLTQTNTKTGYVRRVQCISSDEYDAVDAPTVCMAKTGWQWKDDSCWTYYPALVCQEISAALKKREKVTKSFGRHR